MHNIEKILFTRSLFKRLTFYVYADTVEFKQVCLALSLTVAEVKNTNILTYLNYYFFSWSEVKRPK